MSSFYFHLILKIIKSFKLHIKHEIIKKTFKIIIQKYLNIYVHAKATSIISVFPLIHSRDHSLKVLSYEHETIQLLSADTSQPIIFWSCPFSSFTGVQPGWAHILSK